MVDRPGWVDANAAGMAALLNPLVDALVEKQDSRPGPLATAIGSRATGVQAGGVLAFLSSRVLGQYEIFGTGGRLLLVAPNIVATERKLGVDPRDFRLWVCLHEVTHQLQFTAVPWLRGYLEAQIAAFVDATDLDPEVLRERLQDVLRSLGDAVRGRDGESEGLLALVRDPAQRAVLDRVTAVMSLVEGHAEFVMDGVGPDVVPSVRDAPQAVRPAPQGPRPARPRAAPAARPGAEDEAVRRGPRFVGGVVDRVGMEGFNRVWAGPETLPRIEELADPARWVRAGCTAARPSPPERRAGRGRSAPGRRAAPLAVRPGRGVRGRCWSPAAAEPTRWRSPRPSPSRPAARTCPAARSRSTTACSRARRSGRRPRACCVTLGLAPVAVVRVDVGADGGPEGGRPDGPLRGARGRGRGAAPALRSGTRSTIRPRPCCSGWAAARDRGRWPAWSRSASRTAFRGGARCSACAGRPLGRPAPTRGCRRGTTRGTTTRVHPGPAAHRGPAVAGRGARRRGRSRAGTDGGAAARGPRRPRRPGRAELLDWVGTADFPRTPSRRCPPRCAAGCCAAGCGPVPSRICRPSTSARSTRCSPGGTGRAGWICRAARASSGRLAGWSCCPRGDRAGRRRTRTPDLEELHA